MTRRPMQEKTGLKWWNYLFDMRVIGGPKADEEFIHQLNSFRWIGDGMSEACDLANSNDKLTMVEVTIEPVTYIHIRLCLLSLRTSLEAYCLHENKSYTNVPNTFDEARVQSCSASNWINSVISPPRYLKWDALPLSAHRCMFWLATSIPRWIHY
jgi:hypothetical protein